MRRRGVSLLEAMLSLLLIGLALAALASVVKSASEVSSFSSGKDDSLQAAQLALLRLRDECLEAVRWDSPNSTTLVNEVRFQRLAPDLPPPPSPGPPWDPLAPERQIAVRGDVDNGTLKRQVGPDSLEVGRHVEVLQARFLPSGNLELALQAREKARVVTWKLEAALP